MQQNGIPGPNLGANWTPLTRNVLVTLFVIYVVQLLSNGVVDQLFAWHAFGPEFRPWQVATSFLLGGASPFWVVVSWVVLYIFLSPVDSMVGRRALLQVLGVSWVTGVLVSSVLLATGLIQNETFMGIAPVLAVLTALFGFCMPNAQILLMFVIPVRAIWIAWGTGLIGFLDLLYSRDLGSSLLFFGWGGTWLWMTVRGGALRRLTLRWRKTRIERKLARFEVIEGGRAERRPKHSRDPGDWVN